MTTHDKTEVWSSVAGWPYEVSNLGRVRRSESSMGTWAGRVLSPYSVTKSGQSDRRGYLAVDLYEGDRRNKCTLVHRLVATAFLGDPPSEAHQINHKNSDKHDNRVENLEWVTCSENMVHAVESGAVAPPRAPKTRYTTQDIREAKAMVEGGATLREASAAVGMSAAHLCNILNGKRVPEGLEGALE